MSRDGDAAQADGLPRDIQEQASCDVQFVRFFNAEAKRTEPRGVYEAVTLPSCCSIRFMGLNSIATASLASIQQRRDREEFFGSRRWEESPAALPWSRCMPPHTKDDET